MKNAYQRWKRNSGDIIDDFQKSLKKNANSSHKLSMPKTVSESAVVYEYSSSYTSRKKDSDHLPSFYPRTRNQLWIPQSLQIWWGLKDFSSSWHTHPPKPPKHHQTKQTPSNTHFPQRTNAPNKKNTQTNNACAFHRFLLWLLKAIRPSSKLLMGFH